MLGGATSVRPLEWHCRSELSNRLRWEPKQIERMARRSVVFREAVFRDGDPTEDDGRGATDDAGEEHELHQVDSKDRQSEGESHEAGCGKALCGLDLRRIFREDFRYV